MAMLADDDQRVVPSVLSALVAQGAPGVASVSFSRTCIAMMSWFARRRRSCWQRSSRRRSRRRWPPRIGAAETDSAYLARASILEALAEIDDSLAREVLRAALDDREWARQGAGGEPVGPFGAGRRSRGPGSDRRRAGEASATPPSTSSTRACHHTSTSKWIAAPSRSSWQF